MSLTHVVGVDPGLVHTGLIRMQFISTRKEICVEHLVLDGVDLPAARAWTYAVSHPYVVVEAYRPRSHYASDKDMAEAVRDYKTALKALELPNTGVKKVVRRELMDLLGVWNFSTPTHHQDLRSAARIALLAMLKSEPMNRLLTQVVRAHLEGQPWTVR